MLEAMQKKKAEDAANANVKQYWESVGHREPYWGVLTSDAYKGQQQLGDSDEEKFFASGADEVAFFDRALRAHAGVDLESLGGGSDSAFLDLGCGAGRIAVHMATRCALQRIARSARHEYSSPHLHLVDAHVEKARCSSSNSSIYV